MGKKRGTLQTSYTAGFTPWTWWTQQETANLAVVEPIGFFWHVPERRGPGWRSIDEDWEPPVPAPIRPSCVKCESPYVADVIDSFECMACGCFMDKD